MSEIEELEGGYRRRRRPAPASTPDMAPDQGADHAEGAEAGTLTDVASDLQGTYGNQLVGAALSGTTTEGLQGSMAAQLGAAVGGLGAWSTETMDSNAAMCRAMRHSAGGQEEALSVPSNLGTGGSPLPEQVRQRMEAAMGHDFSHVRIHTGGAAHKASKDINAHAFTTGAHIYFGSGEFQPGTTRGDRLIAHELTHVIQHDEHRLSLPDSDRAVSKPTDPTEVEAYANEKAVLSELEVVDAALASGASEAEISPARTTDEIVDTVSEGALAQSSSAGHGALHRDLLGGIVDSIMDAADMREDEERLDAEEELEAFMSQEYEVSHFHPETGRGNIDGHYDPSAGVLQVRVGVFFNFLDGNPSVNPDWIAWQNRNPTLAFPSAAFQWTPEEEEAYARNAIAEVVSAWEGQYTFSTTRPHWQALPDVNVQIVIEQVDQAAAHYAIDVIKWPLDVGIGAHIDRPGHTHGHSHGSTDPDHVGAEFNESAGDGDISNPDESHYVRDHTSRSAYGDADAANPEVVFFDSASTTVPSMYHSALRQLGEVLGRAEMPPFPLELVGHASKDGDAEENQRLSEERADAVLASIVAGGPKVTPTASGVGEQDAGWEAEWRRVDIKLCDFVSEQTTVVHEFGHIFGLADEYPAMDNPTGTRQVGDEVAHSEIAQNLVEGQEPVVAHHSESVMSNGEQIKPFHYVTFLEMLGVMTETTGEWKIGPGPGPGLGQNAIPACGGGSDGG